MTSRKQEQFTKKTFPKNFKKILKILHADLKAISPWEELTAISILHPNTIFHTTIFHACNFYFLFDLTIYSVHFMVEMIVRLSESYGRDKMADFDQYMCRFFAAFYSFYKLKPTDYLEKIESRYQLYDNCSRSDAMERLVRALIYDIEYGGFVSLTAESPDILSVDCKKRLAITKFVQYFDQSLDNTYRRGLLQLCNFFA